VFNGLFGSKKKLELNRFDTYVDPEMTINGTVEYAGTLKVAGKIFGKLKQKETEGTFTVIVDGEIRTDHIDADFVVVNGKVIGTVYASQHLIVGPKGHIDGDVFYGTVVIERGGVIRGRFNNIEPSQATIIQLPLETTTHET
jgi:cytoskeletal protein CcmA (bactofilin family)